jgi:hypothetical protein
MRELILRIIRQIENLLEHPEKEYNNVSKYRVLMDELAVALDNPAITPNNHLRNMDNELLEELFDLSYDLSYYEPNEELRKQFHFAYYGTDRLKEEILPILNKLRKIALDMDRKENLDIN